MALMRACIDTNNKSDDIHFIQKRGFSVYFAKVYGAGAVVAVCSWGNPLLVSDTINLHKKVLKCMFIFLSTRVHHTCVKLCSVGKGGVHYGMCLGSFFMLRWGSGRYVSIFLLCPVAKT